MEYKQQLDKTNIQTDPAHLRTFKRMVTFSHTDPESTLAQVMTKGDTAKY
jgi:hypothetical protein